MIPGPARVATLAVPSCERRRQETKEVTHSEAAAGTDTASSVAACDPAAAAPINTAAPPY